MAPAPTRTSRQLDPRASRLTTTTSTSSSCRRDTWTRCCYLRAPTWRVVVIVTRRHVSQLSGEKTWHVHAPPRGEELPRYSSHDFKVDEIGPPLDVFNLKQVVLDRTRSSVSYLVRISQSLS